MNGNNDWERSVSFGYVNKSVDIQAIAGIADGVTRKEYRVSASFSTTSIFPPP